MSGSLIEVEFTPENIAIIHMKGEHKRFNPEFIDAFCAALDTVERNPTCRALITTGNGRFFSNGLDLEYMMSLDGSGLSKWMTRIQGFLYRVVTFPMPTVAAINGHAFAGGGFLAMSHDFRVMRKGQGWISWNEIFIKLRFSDFLMEILRCKVPNGSAQLQAVVLGARFTAEEAARYGIIDVATAPETMMQEAVTVAKKTLGRQPYDRETLTQFKADLYSSLKDKVAIRRPRL
ncbi:enoyl-CoA delta isomerase 3-like [Haliotis rufescens]|uniref:enoyl-CoA delta isomerase 3-like n=1 Tax=Haliotis rufescens TaxID=6454 RepID=UPI00201E9DBD|nr:enoyl-CoA delta isomerase 3-like [Haliotis rufescens]